MLMRKTTLFFSHEYAALELSLGFKLVFSEAAHWDGQQELRNTGLPVTCNSALCERDEHKFCLVFSSVIKSKGLHHGQEDSKCCCSFFVMPGSYFLWKTLLISRLQLSTLGRMKGKKDFFPMRFHAYGTVPSQISKGTGRISLWTSDICDPLLSFSVQSVWNSPLSYSFPWLWSMEPNSHTHPAHI